MDGLKPELTTQVCHLYVGMRHTMRLEELCRHAKHAQDVLTERKQKSSAKKDYELHQATLTLFSECVEDLAEAEGDADKGSEVVHA